MFAQASAQGSPPRMRGKVHQLREAAQFGGITPAYAGKRWTRLPSRAAMRDHPRVCGEKRSAGLGGRDGLGSPPRMRGKDRKDTDDAGIERITPAYAGKRQPDGQRRQLHRDHPRVCGEKSLPPRPMRAQRGSPPRMRGKGHGKMCSLGLNRITPAYAGKRLGETSRPLIVEDHPRVCGEKINALAPAAADTGSPPRMRGKAAIRFRPPGGLGITPAYAGKRLKRSRSTVPPVAIVPLFPSVCNKPVVSDGSPAGRDAPLFLPAENAVPASPAYNLRSL